MIVWHFSLFITAHFCNTAYCNGFRGNGNEGVNMRYWDGRNVESQAEGKLERSLCC